MFSFKQENKTNKITRNNKGFHSDLMFVSDLWRRIDQNLSGLDANVFAASGLIGCENGSFNKNNETKLSKNASIGILEDKIHDSVGKQKEPKTGSING